MEIVDWVLAGLRVWVGYVMLRHGINHGRSLQGTASWFSKIGFRRADTQARLSAVGEVAMGAALIVGLLTPFAAAGVIATMAVAFWTVHRFAGFFVFSRPDEGWEYVATLALVALALAVLGGGRISLDAALGVETQLDGWPGLAIGLGGLVIAGVQLALFWRAPERQKG